MRFGFNFFGLFAVALAAIMTTAVAEDCQTIGELACADDDLTMLCDLVEMLDQENVLSGNETLTVFAPTDAAFDAIGIEELDLAERQLADILLFHVAAGAVYAADLVCKAGDNLLEMANGKDTRTLCLGGEYYQKGKGNPKDDMPKVDMADIDACNGVIHKIDGVLLPFVVDTNTTRV